MMIDEETNASLLRLLSCFLMSAPQAIIQLVFLLSQYKKAFNSLPITFEVTFLGIKKNKYITKKEKQFTLI